MSNRGGARIGSGRKSKAEEQSLVEKLSPLSDLAFEALTDALESKKDWAVKLFFEYTYGKPKQQIDQNTNLTTSDIDWTKLFK
jgi:hypothetical protein